MQLSLYASYSQSVVHHGPKQKLSLKRTAGYRAPSLQWMSCCDAFSSSSVVSRAFSALCVYSKFGHHPHPLGYVCAKFSFFWSSNAELTHGEKLRTQSLTQSLNRPAYLMCWEPKLSLWSCPLTSRGLKKGYASTRCYFV